jgi:hypothetical protein
VLHRSKIRPLAAPRPRRPLIGLAGIAIVACANSFARGSDVTGVPDCSATGGDWSCYLPGIFHFLLVIAIFLGLILAGVIFLAVKSYLKNKDDEKVDP